MKKKRLLLILLFLLLTASGVLLISPYPRQLVFGPKIQGVPLCAWQEEFRRRHGAETPEEVGFWDGFLTWFRTDNSALDWRLLSTTEMEEMLLPLIRDPIHLVREGVIEELGRLESRGATLALVNLLDDPSETIRNQAARQFTPWRKDAGAALPMLTKLLHHAHSHRRKLAVECIACIGPHSKEIRNLLLGMMKDQDASVRAAAIGSFSLLPTLTAMLKSPVKWTRAKAAEGLGLLGPDAKDAVPALIELLSDPDNAPRHYSTSALGSIGPDARAAIPSLLRRLHDPNIRRDTVVDALGKIGLEPSEVVPAIIPLLTEKDLRSCAVDALGRFGQEARAAIPRLIILLDGDDLDLADAAAEALAKIDPARFAGKKHSPQK